MEKIKIKLSKEFYKKEAIETALEDFKDICEGIIITSNQTEDKDKRDKDERYTIIELMPKKEIKEPLKEEFCNYVLGIMKNNNLL